MSVRIYIIAIAAMVILGLSGCVSEDYIRDASRMVKAADWSKIQTINISLTEYAFSPSSLVLKKGIPYKLEIMNRGTEKHYFVSEGFFKAIATRKLQSNVDGEIKAPYFSAIEVFAGRSLDLYFIPVRKGNYRLQCTIEGHAERGMTGQISIE